jgi:tRNA(fMet)-specific endonuclease VapC
MLDTNVAIHLRDRDEATMDRVLALGGEVMISVITRVELEGGVYQEPSKSRTRRERLDAILASLPTVPFDDQASDAYRAIVEAVGFSRRNILDRMIAAQSLVHRATLVTFNADDFRDVPGLDLLEWRADDLRP